MLFFLPGVQIPLFCLVLIHSSGVSESSTSQNNSPQLHPSVTSLHLYKIHYDLQSRICYLVTLLTHETVSSMRAIIMPLSCCNPRVEQKAWCPVNMTQSQYCLHLNVEKSHLLNFSLIFSSPSQLQSIPKSNNNKIRRKNKRY